MSKRNRDVNKDVVGDEIRDIKRQKTNKSLLDELTNAFADLNLDSTEENDGGIDEITKGVRDLNMGPIKVVVMPFAHGGVRPATNIDTQLVEGMDVKLITSTSGTCTLVRSDSYIKLLSTIATRVKFRKHTTDPNFDNQLLDYFNNFQNYTVNAEDLGTPTYLPEMNKYWHRLPSKQTHEGYVDVVSDTYEMTNFNNKDICTKVYGPIPKTDVLWSAIQPIANLMKINAIDYSNKPFVIYMYRNQKGIFKVGITPNTYNGITLHEILESTNESIKKELTNESIKKELTNESIKKESTRKVHYVFADPNCSYGDSGCTFGEKSKNKRHTKDNKKSRKVRPTKSVRLTKKYKNKSNPKSRKVLK